MWPWGLHCGFEAVLMADREDTLEGTQEATVQGWNYVLSVQKGSTRTAKVGGTEFCESIKLFTIKASNT